MAKKKNVPDSAAAGSSRNADKKAIKNLKGLNAKLVKELEKHQKEIRQLHQQIAAATEQLELTTADINELEMQLLNAIGEKHAFQRELNLIRQHQHRDLNCFQKAESEKAWWKKKKKKKKWVYPTIAILFTSTAVLTLCTKNSRIKK